MSERPPRQRYVAFRVEGPRPFRRDEVLDALRTLPDRPWLVDYQGTEGLVRCTNRNRDTTVVALTSIRSIGGEAVVVATLGTSGTIRRARLKYLPGWSTRRRPTRKNPYK